VVLKLLAETKGKGGTTESDRKKNDRVLKKGTKRAKNTKPGKSEERYERDNKKKKKASRTTAGGKEGGGRKREERSALGSPRKRKISMIWVRGKRKKRM